MAHLACAILFIIAIVAPAARQDAGVAKHFSTESVEPKLSKNPGWVCVVNFEGKDPFNGRLAKFDKETGMWGVVPEGAKPQIQVPEENLVPKSVEKRREPCPKDLATSVPDPKAAQPQEEKELDDPKAAQPQEEELEPKADQPQEEKVLDPKAAEEAEKDEVDPDSAGGETADENGAE